MKILIMGGGTFSDVTPHLSLCTRAFGTTAKQFKSIFDNKGVESKLVLTKMADSSSGLISNSDVDDYLKEALKDSELKAIIFNVAMCDFNGNIAGYTPNKRLISNDMYDMTLYPDLDKVIAYIKTERPDIFLVSFKTTAFAERTEQIIKAREQITKTSSDLVLANDIKTRRNILVMEHYSSESIREALLDTITNEVIRACYPSKPFNLTHPKDYLPQIENSISIQD